MGNFLPSPFKGGEDHQAPSRAAATSFGLEELPDDLVWKVLAEVKDLDTATWVNLRACCHSFRRHISPQVDHLTLDSSAASQLWRTSKWAHPATTFPAAKSLQAAADAPRELIAQMLTSMPRVQELDVSHDAGSAPFWYLAQDVEAVLPACTRLTSLQLPLHCSLDSFERLRSLTGLTSLALSVNGRCHGHHIRNQHLDSLRELSALTSLRLVDITCAVGHRTLPMLGMLSSLQVLEMVDAKIDDIAIALLVRLRHLKRLSIKSVKLAPQSGLSSGRMSQLSSLSSLQHIQLHVRDSHKRRGVTPITPELLTALGDLPNLTSLTLCGFALPPIPFSFQSASRFSSLAHLTVMSAGYVIPGSLEVLGLHQPLPNLSVLHISQCLLHDPAAILKMVAQHTHLHTLSVGAAYSTKVLTKSSLKPLLGLSELRQLKLSVVAREGGKGMAQLQNESWFSHLMSHVGDVSVHEGSDVATMCSTSCCCQGD